MSVSVFGHQIQDDLLALFYANLPDVQADMVVAQGMDILAGIVFVIGGASVGLLFRDLPVGIRFNKEMTLRELFADVHNQIQKGIEHCCYPYVEKDRQVVNDDTAYLLYQQDMRDMGGLEELNVESIEIRQNQAASQTIIDMEILDGEDGLVLMIDYAASLYKDESMDKFRDLFVNTAQALVTYDSQDDVTIDEIRKKLADKKNLFETVKSIFRRKR